MLENEGIGLANAAQVRAGNLQWQRLRAPKGKEQRVIIAAQLAHGDIAPAHNAHAEIDPALAQGLHPPPDDRAVHFEAGQAVHQPAAGGMGVVHDRNGIALAREGVRRHQAAQAGPDDDDFLAGGGQRRRFLDPVPPAVIEEKTGNGADGDGGRRFVKHTGCFAHPIGRADVGDKFGQALGLEKQRRRLPVLPGGGQAEQVGNGNAQRTGGDAVRVGALDATAGLFAGGGFIVGRGDGVEIGQTIRHRPVSEVPLLSHSRQAYLPVMPHFSTGPVFIWLNVLILQLPSH